MLPVAPVTATSLMESMSLSDEATSRGSELERPEESVHFLEMGTNGVNLVDDILGAVDAQMTEILRNQTVVGQGDSGSVDLEISSLVHELAHSGQRRVSESNIWSDSSEHLGNWTIDLQENTIMELLQSEELQDLSWLRSHLVNTDQSGDEQELGLGLNKEVTAFSCLAAESDEVGLTGSVLFQVLDGA